MVAGWFQDRKCVKIIVGQHQKGTLRVSTHQILLVTCFHENNWVEKIQYPKNFNLLRSFWGRIYLFQIYWHLLSGLPSNHVSEVSNNAKYV